MSPLDDELHAALHDRAGVITAPSDPFAGIESRARSIRRRRWAASLASAALAVAVAAVAVPALVPDGSSKAGPAGHGTATLEPTPTPTTTQTPSEDQPPANVLTSWPQRGSAPNPPSVAAVQQAFADGMGRSSEVRLVRYRELFVSSTGKGEAFTMGQAWFAGDTQAYSVSYTVPPNGAAPELFLGKPTPANPVLLAFVVPNLAGMSDLLIVVPQPATGQVLYASSGTGAFRPITDQSRFDGVVMIDRQLTDTHDRLQLLDGNGDMNHPTFEGPVAPLLCALKECG
ncbi:MAG: hypothetical protein JWM40_333 [Frankiales bacterium]|nr:hypothetical protein [Frankiales bacterium]